MILVSLKVIIFSFEMNGWTGYKIFDVAEDENVGNISFSVS